LVAACAVGLSACGGGGSGQNSGTAVEQKRLTSSQKTTDNSAYNQVVEELYVSYFGRPADPTGLTNFSARLAQAGAPTDIQSLVTVYNNNSNATVTALVNSFGTSAESEALYGTGDNSAFLTQIYVNVLGRAPDPDGFSFWLAALNSNKVTYGGAALNVMAGALADATQSTQGGQDQTLVNDHITVAIDFTNAVTAQNAVAAYSGATAAQTARNMLSSITINTPSNTYQSIATSAVEGIVASN